MPAGNFDLFDGEVDGGRVVVRDDGSAPEAIFKSLDAAVEVSFVERARGMAFNPDSKARAASFLSRW